MTNANDNATYHLAKLDRTQITTPVVGKQIKSFKNRHEAELDPLVGIESDDLDQEDE